MARRAQAGRRPTGTDIRREEFKALRDTSSQRRVTGYEFETEHVEVPQAFTGFLERVIIVRRLREVRAIGGFTRIDSPVDMPGEEEDEPRQYRVQTLSRTDVDWRPAVELRGEGVFLELAQERLRTWEQREDVRHRSLALEKGASRLATRA